MPTKYRRRISRRTSGSTTSSTYTPAQKAVKPGVSQSGKVIPGSPAIPAQRVTTTTPGNTEVITEQSGEGGGSGVAVALLILLVFVAFSSFFNPLMDSIWNKKNFSPSISPWIVLGAIIFIVGMEILASSSDEGKSLAWIMTAGLWIIYIMFNGSKQIAGTINTVTNSKPSKQSSSTAHLIGHTF